MLQNKLGWPFQFVWNSDFEYLFKIQFDIEWRKGRNITRL
jgi:hypothetical protein